MIYQRVLMGLMVAFMGTAANADTTNCMVHGTMITCHGQSGGADQQGSASQGISDFIGTLNEKSFRKKIGGMLAVGDCAGATDYALRKGRLELAAELHRSCAIHFGQSTGIGAQTPTLETEVQQLLASGDCKGAIRLAYQNGKISLGDSLFKRCPAKTQP